MVERVTFFTYTPLDVAGFALFKSAINASTFCLMASAEKPTQQLVDSNDWDTEEALKLRQTLNQWGAGYEPELVSLDVDIRLKSLDR